jgi:hypothetical protein
MMDVLVWEESSRLAVTLRAAGIVPVDDAGGPVDDDVCFLEFNGVVFDDGVVVDLSNSVVVGVDVGVDWYLGVGAMLTLFALLLLALSMARRRRLHWLLLWE